MTQLPISVLVVEDDNVSRDLLDMLFAQEPGIYYSVAAGGANAIAKLAEGPPDVIVTDLMMPRVSGMDVAVFARKLYPDIPIIAVSAAPMSVDLRDQRLGQEPVHFLGKPFDLDRLLSLVRQLGADRAWRVSTTPKR